jgi:hypothetical protein
MRFVSRLLSLRFSGWLTIGNVIMGLVWGIYALLTLTNLVDHAFDPIPISSPYAESNYLKYKQYSDSLSWTKFFFSLYVAYFAPKQITDAVRNLWRKSRVPCSYCAELIKSEANICLYCRNEVNRPRN